MSIPQDRKTKLSELLGSLDQWDDQSWFLSERYLLSRTTVLSMAALLDQLEVPNTVPRCFKTDMVKMTGTRLMSHPLCEL